MTPLEFFSWLAERKEGGVASLYPSNAEAFRVSIGQGDIIAARLLSQIDQFMPKGLNSTNTEVEVALQTAWFCLKNAQMQRTLPETHTYELTSARIYEWLRDQDVASMDNQMAVLEAAWWWMVFWGAVVTVGRQHPPPQEVSHIPRLLCQSSKRGYYPPEHTARLN